jgi:hypothetical protein
VDELANLSPDKIEAMLDRLEAEKLRRLTELRGDAYVAAVKKLEWLAWMRDIDFPTVTYLDALYDAPSSTKPGRAVSKLPPSAKVVSLSEARARRANTDLGEAYR